MPFKIFKTEFLSSTLYNCNSLYLLARFYCSSLVVSSRFIDLRNKNSICLRKIKPSSLKSQMVMDALRVAYTRQSPLQRWLTRNITIPCQLKSPQSS